MFSTFFCSEFQVWFSFVEFLLSEGCDESASVVLRWYDDMHVHSMGFGALFCVFINADGSSTIDVLVTCGHGEMDRQVHECNLGKVLDLFRYQNVIDRRYTIVVVEV